MCRTRNEDGSKPRWSGVLTVHMMAADLFSSLALIRIMRSIARHRRRQVKRFQMRREHGRRRLIERMRRRENCPLELIVAVVELKMQFAQRRRKLQ
jgi:hypothetical protein